MSDEGKCYAATPAATLEEHIVNSNVAKSDTEWWAHHEITRLRADLAAVTAERDRMREALAAEKALTNACERVNRRNDELLDKVRSLREALKPFSDAASTDDYIDDIEIAETDTARKITFGDLRRARAAIECVTKKEGAGNE